MIQLLRHIPSGDLYAARTENDTITALSGPLYSPAWINGETDDALRPDWQERAADELADDPDATDNAAWAQSQEWRILSDHLRAGEYL